MIADAQSEGLCTLTNGCAALAVSTSGYRAWRRRKAQGATRHQQQDAALTERIVAIHAASHQAYGSPRIHAALQKAGVCCSKQRVARLMREAELRSRRAAKPRRPQTTHSKHALPVAPNLLDRNFVATAPNQKWVADVTYIPTDAGWHYLAVLLDLYSRRIVGWAMGSRFTRALVGRALSQALEVRKAPALLHSDRGVQYASHHYQELLRAAGIACSMSRRGNCYDNAVMESFFASLKSETLLSERAFANLEEANRHLFAWIEGFYNLRRLHSTLGYQSPADFETTTATAPERDVA